ncbi:MULTISPECIES: winged helix-turn-helix transcriptional regulator [Mediterranea]|uniref:winged helix-turn-helix transcriptional regulator n=1 Tax=Mediterranea TaxID=1926659 RepID=UPI002010E1EC|nr:MULTISPECIES: winged helix-turn-helix transcriptional regulator [Mediterranea]MCL1608637.1 winged helix-turn-helix transcriptional regulator [Mediterranea sp. ET5]MDM8123741.1 winged helix-turn-helix transcriptional regulator [Mediterranea massiliensis]MDM8199382.1 winged helix-turn-helix transcriptional regulator [Mediterranea massiliensis]
MQILFVLLQKVGRKANKVGRKSREKIIALLSQDNSLSAATLAERIGITPKAVEKHIAKMKAEGILKRVGPDRGGHWQVVEKTD